MTKAQQITALKGFYNRFLLNDTVLREAKKAGIECGPHNTAWIDFVAARNKLVPGENFDV